MGGEAEGRTHAAGQEGRGQWRPKGWVLGQGVCVSVVSAVPRLALAPEGLLPVDRRQPSQPSHSFAPDISFWRWVGPGWPFLEVDGHRGLEVRSIAAWRPARQPQGQDLDPGLWTAQQGGAGGWEPAAML